MSRIYECGFCMFESVIVISVMDVKILFSYDFLSYNVICQRK